MAIGMPYDAMAVERTAALTSLMTGHLPRCPHRESDGCFFRFTANEKYMLNVLWMHRDANREIETSMSFKVFVAAASEA